MMRNPGGGPGSISSQRDFLLANANNGFFMDGEMSSNRRFFCTFLFFQFVFVTFVWILSPMVQGANVKDVFVLEVLHYSIYTSLFDVAVFSFIRFLLLLLIYGKLRYSHCWVVATTCGLNCIFLIAKTFIYQWPHGESHPFEVMLVLVAFVACWVEIWFMDLKVLPQERKEKCLAELANQEGVVDDENQRNMDRLRQFLTSQPESVANFYSPLESPQGSEYGDPPSPPHLKKLTPEEVEIVLCGENAWQRALQLLEGGGWMEERRLPGNYVVYSKIGPKAYKVYKLEAVFDVSSDQMFMDCIYNIEDVPKWNKNISSVTRVKELCPNCDVVYQISSNSARNVVTARDFVNVRHWRKYNESWVVSGVSVTHKEYPPVKTYVRGENGPNCLVFTPDPYSANKCRFQWLLDVDLKGWIPRGVLNQALVNVVCDFVNQMDKHIQEKKNTSIP